MRKKPKAELKLPNTFSTFVKLTAQKTNLKANEIIKTSSIAKHENPRKSIFIQDIPQKLVGNKADEKSRNLKGTNNKSLSKLGKSR